MSGGRLVQRGHGLGLDHVELDDGTPAVRPRCVVDGWQGGFHYGDARLAEHAARMDYREHVDADNVALAFGAPGAPV